MYDLIVKLILISAILQFGLSLSDLRGYHNRECAQRIEKASRKVLRIDWKPISVFPEEARRFDSTNIK